MVLLESNLAKCVNIKISYKFSPSHCIPGTLHRIKEFSQEYLMFNYVIIHSYKKLKMKLYVLLKENYQ